MRVRKDDVIALGKTALTKNSSTKFITSDFTIDQHVFKKLKLNPSGPGLLFPSELQIISLTSSSVKGSVKIALFAAEIESKLIPFKKGLLSHSSEKQFAK
ncbi:unnamed protein product [Trifolium pratense]|uniref:Uncharacterized protein n=1 Tax=Trifolium pratense TaxID=57577 RepID=A0ACB0J1W3_TRIPR|nr:unnamed protein product [Trifolium pratense]